MAMRRQERNYIGQIVAILSILAFCFLAWFSFNAAFEYSYNKNDFIYLLMVCVSLFFISLALANNLFGAFRK